MAYDSTNNTVRVAGYGDVPETLGVKTYWKNFNPRTGISWRIAEDNVLRAGYGVSALPWPSSYGQDYPVRQTQQLTGIKGFAPAGALAIGMPTPVTVAIPANGILDATALRGEALGEVPVDRYEGQLHSWNVAYQRALRGGLTAEVAYVGNRGAHILQSIDLNAGYTLGADEAGRPLRVQYGRTAASTTPIPVKSQYNSLQIKVDRRMRGGLLLTNSYTLGRGYSYINGDGTGGTIPTPADIERSWQRTSNDSTHSYANQLPDFLPFGPQGKWIVRVRWARYSATGRSRRLSAILGYPSTSPRAHHPAGTGQQPDTRCERYAESLGGIGQSDPFRLRRSLGARAESWATSSGAVC